MSDMSCKQDRASGAYGGAVRAFTLIELLVAIGCVALLGVGIAEIFHLTGKTVSAGRRLSALTAYASSLERQMRADFSHMSRDGFLVIRNELSSTPVALTSESTVARQRRIDEIQFFVTGSFTSQRQPADPSRTAQGTAARIYYGHGLQNDPTSANYFKPVALDNTNDNTTDVHGFGVGGTGQNPNQYASDWILARHVTVLCPPSTFQHASVINKNQLETATEHDNDVQIGLQPASPDIFRTIVAGYNVSGERWFRPDSVVKPLFSSGVIDIAATDLSRVRSVIMDAKQVLSTYQGPTDTFMAGQDPTLANSVPANMQAQMRDSLPADSDGASGKVARIRVENAPANPLGVSWSDTPTDAQRADEQMLASSAFAPHCTEFIVEWSFGQVYNEDYVDGTGTKQAVLPTDPRYGTLVWYGFPRAVGAPGLQYNILPYWDARMAAQGTAYPLRGSSYKLNWTANKELISPQPTRNVGPNAKNVQYSYFGFVDPTYVPDAISRADKKTGLLPTDLNILNGTKILQTLPPMFIDVNHDGFYDPADGDVLTEPLTVPWLWPKLIRVTISLADPSDPTVEQTFQFVFKVPEAQPGGSL